MTLPPRLDPDEIEYLSEVLATMPEGTRMVEWGSGGSTLLFLPYFETGKLTSIEHNPEWFDKVSKEACAGEYSAVCLSNFTYCLIRPTYMAGVVDPRFYGYGVPMEENPCFAASYINPESGGTRIWDADIYFVDGICRGAILSTILQHAENRYAEVYVHDYYGPENREGWYNWASSMYKSIEKVGSTLARLTL